MSRCERCAGDCSACSGCGAGALTLTAEEVAFLQKLGEVAFLPVARTMEEDKPISLTEEGDAAFMSLILQCLEKKDLISIDYDKPLKGFVYDSRYHRLYRGSVGLTLRGQQVLEMLEIQGISEE